MSLHRWSLRTKWLFMVALYWYLTWLTLFLVLMGIKCFFTFLARPVKHIELLWPKNYWSNSNAGPCFYSRKASFLPFIADKVQYLPILKKQNKNLLVELDIISNDLSEVLSFHMSICSHRPYFSATLSLTSPPKRKISRCFEIVSAQTVVWERFSLKLGKF